MIRIDILEDVQKYGRWKLVIQTILLRGLEHVVLWRNRIISVLVNNNWKKTGSLSLAAKSLLVALIEHSLPLFSNKDIFLCIDT